MNALTKSLKSIYSNLDACFEKFDELEKTNPTQYKKFHELELKYPKIFHLARKFEGNPRQATTHASGILVTPIPINDVIPTRVEDGETIALFGGSEVEEINLIKYDILGLKTLTVIKKTLNMIHMTFNELYDKADTNDSKVYKLICDGKSDGVFQIESPLYKGLISQIKPNSLNDLSAMVAIGRPGPLSAGIGQKYSAWKKDYNSREIYLKGIDDILKDSYGALIYQEQLMLIARRVSGFNLAQSDSIVRKILGKKKVKKLEMLRRMLIYGKKNCTGPEGWEDDPNAPWYDPDGEHYGDEICGAVANGYTVEEMNRYYETIKGFASYCFNRAHSAAYGYIALLTAWLKTYYPTEYMSALLSMQADDESKTKYMSVCTDMGIKIVCPDINKSNPDFTPIDKETISYGLASIKGVKEISDIVAERPFKNLEDILERVPKKSFNKRVAFNMIKSGALCNIEGKNRNATLNKLMDLRKDKDDRLDPDKFTREVCIEYEVDTIGSTVTYPSSWTNILPGETLTNQFVKIVKVKPYKTKAGKDMAFLRLSIDGIAVDGILFPKDYSRLKNLAAPKLECFMTGVKNKDERKNTETFVVNNIITDAEEIKQQDNEAVFNPAMPVFYDPFAGVTA